MISEEDLAKYKKLNMQEIWDANGVRDKLVNEIRRLRRALKFYAGRLREDGNGYEFDKEPTGFLGGVARRALGVKDKRSCRKR